MITLSSTKLPLNPAPVTWNHSKMPALLLNKCNLNPNVVSSITMFYYSSQLKNNSWSESIRLNYILLKEEKKDSTPGDVGFGWRLRDIELCREKILSGHVHTDITLFTLLFPNSNKSGISAVCMVSLHCFLAEVAADLPSFPPSASRCLLRSRGQRAAHRTHGGWRSWPKGLPLPLQLLPWQTMA